MDGNYGGFPRVDGHGILPSFEYWSDYLLEDVPVLESSTMDGNYGGFPHVDGHGILPSSEYGSDYLLEDVPVLGSSIISPPVIVAAGGSPERTFTVENITMEEQNSAQNRQAMNINNGWQAGSTKPPDHAVSRIAIRTKSELDVLDDGFKWRKYGQKQVKNSPIPRSYYRCSTSGCQVKKKVERDPEDTSYVITTYDGVHNHEARPSSQIVYCTPRRLGEHPPPAAGAVVPFQGAPRPLSLQATTKLMTP